MLQPTIHSKSKWYFMLCLCIAFVPLYTMAQLRQSKPLPHFPKKITHKLQSGLTGWCYTLDGQWVTADMKIPERFISTDKESYNLQEHKDGNDNIKELQILPVLYGEDTLIMLIKYYQDGFYEFEARKKGWQNVLMAYYYLFRQSELQRLKQSINSEVQVIDLNILDYGQIRDADRFNIIEQIKPKVVIQTSTQRKLQFIIQKNYPENKIRFQFASIYPYVIDAEGVRRDFTLNGKSLYGNPLLLDYIYYECKAKVLENFLNVNIHQEFVHK
jgi:hypothetical protein